MNHPNHHRGEGFPVVNIIDRVRGLASAPDARVRSEPFLENVMADPIVRQLIAADHLDENDVRRAVDRARRRLCHR